MNVQLMLAGLVVAFAGFLILYVLMKIRIIGPGLILFGLMSFCSIFGGLYVFISGLTPGSSSDVIIRIMVFIVVILGVAYYFVINKKRK